MANCHDVANYIVSRFNQPISTMKLQKLLFFSHGWSLAFLNEPIAKDVEFEAWLKGPVCRELFRNHRGDYAVSSWEWGDSGALSEKQKVVIDGVLKNYGALTGRKLSELTHEGGTPWSVTREKAGVARNGSSSQTITDETIARYFKKELHVKSH